MPHFEGNGGPFRVHCSGAIAKSLKKIQRRASKEGRGKQAIAAFEQIIQRLRRDPANFGEPLYRLPALRMQIRAAVIPPLPIQFGVSEDQPLVFIKIVDLLSKPGE